MTDGRVEVQASVFARMQAERQRIALRYRAEGEEKAREIRAGADREREIILARAYSTSQRQRGEGDAQATAVTGRAFGQDPGYYAFQRRLETYERIFADGTTTVLLRPDSDLLRFLESPRPRRRGSPPPGSGSSRRGPGTFPGRMPSPVSPEEMPMIALEAGVKKAVEWITEQLRNNAGADRAALIDEASQRFGLSPLQTDFLYRQFLQQAE